MEVLGLALWGAHLWSVMAGKYGPPQATEEDACPGSEPAGAGVPFGPETRIGEILKRRPELLETFLAFGFRPLANPILRRSIAPYVTIERACNLLNVDRERLLGALNAARRETGGRVSLPVLSGPSGP